MAGAVSNQHLLGSDPNTAKTQMIKQIGAGSVVIATSYPFLGIFWSMLIFLRG